MSVSESIIYKDFESHLYKALRECIDDSDGRDGQNMWRDCKCSAECSLSVLSNWIVLRCAKYALACLILLFAYLTDRLYV
jgi:hypothetical protein